MNDFFANIPARGAALMERDRMMKAGLAVAGVTLGAVLVYKFYKPILAGAAVLFVASRPPIKRALNRFTGRGGEETP